MSFKKTGKTETLGVADPRDKEKKAEVNPDTHPLAFFLRAASTVIDAVHTPTSQHGLESGHYLP